MLRYKADRRTLAFLAAHALLIAIGFIFWNQMTWAMVALLCAVNCWMHFTTAVITHNTIHAPMFKSVRANRVAQLAISLLYGGSVSVFVRGHNYSHHRYTQTPRDLMRTTKARLPLNILNQLFFIAIVAPAIERSNKQYVARERELQTPWYYQHRTEKWATLAATAALLLLNYKAAIFFFLIPRVFGLWGITGINYVQHDGCDPDSKFNHSRNITSRWTNWWLFNNGFHTIHHNHPGMHWSKLRDAHEAKVKPHIHPELDQPSLLAYCFRAYIFPGRRLDMYGKPVVLGPAEPDQDWFPNSEEMRKEISVGAV